MPDSRLPLVPEDIPQQHRVSRSVEHAAFAALRSAAENKNALTVCRDLYPRDARAAELLDLVQRAAQPPALTTQPGWAQELISTTVAPFLMELPTSAAAQLIARGTSIPLEGVGAVNVPGLAGLPAAAAWVGEAAVMPIRQQTLGHAQLSPRKMAVILTVSGELVRYFGAEPIFRQILNAIAGVSLDTAYFGAQAGDAITHQGLLFGLSPVTATSTATIDVLSALAAAVGAGGSGAPLVYISGPGRAAAAALRSPAEFSAIVLPSLAVAENRIICIDPRGLVHGAGLPEITAGASATVHSADPASGISAPGTPNVVSAPVYSTYQADLLALRLLVPIAFSKLRANAVAYTDLS